MGLSAPDAKDKSVVLVFGLRLFSLGGLLVRHISEVIAHETRKLHHELTEFWVATVFHHCLLRILAKFFKGLHVLRVLECFQEFGVLRQFLEELRCEPVFLGLLVVGVHRLLDLFKFQLFFLGFGLDVRLVFHLHFWLLLNWSSRFLLFWSWGVQETSGKSTKTIVFLCFFSWLLWLFHCICALFVRLAALLAATGLLLFLIKVVIVVLGSQSFGLGCVRLARAVFEALLLFGCKSDLFGVVLRLASASAEFSESFLFLLLVDLDLLGHVFQGWRHVIAIAVSHLWF